LSENSGHFFKKKFYSYPDSINKAIRQIAETDKDILIIKTEDLSHKGDYLHFNSLSLRELGKRYAETYEKYICHQYGRTDRNHN